MEFTEYEDEEEVEKVEKEECIGLQLNIIIIFNNIDLGLDSSCHFI